MNISGVGEHIKTEQNVPVHPDATCPLATSACKMQDETEVKQNLGARRCRGRRARLLLAKLASFKSS